MFIPTAGGELSQCCCCPDGCAMFDQYNSPLVDSDNTDHDSGTGSTVTLTTSNEDILCPGDSVTLTAVFDPTISRAYEITIAGPGVVTSSSPGGGTVSLGQVQWVLSLTGHGPHPPVVFQAVFLVNDPICPGPVTFTVESGVESDPEDRATVNANYICCPG